MLKLFHFNNDFFKHISNYLPDDSYKKIYKDSNQEIQQKKGGYVSISFIDSIKNNVTEEDDDNPNKDERYAASTLDAVNEALKNGFQYRDISVLVQKNKNGYLLANHLSKNNIPIISSESLLLKNHAGVRFLINLIKLIIQPENKEALAQLLLEFASIKEIPNAHDFLVGFTRHTPENFYNEYGFDSSYASTHSFYELMEYAIARFGLASQSDAYLTYFLEEIWQFNKPSQGGIYGFLSHWELNEDKWSIAAPEGVNAVTIMTVHKSKGLEFPVVIFPYANASLSFEINPKIWYDVIPENHEGFSSLLINKNNEVAQYSNYGQALIDEHISKVILDKINVLYVALTRAENHLYVISEYNSLKKESDTPNTYSQLFIDYLKKINRWREGQLQYEFGSPLIQHQQNVQKEEDHLPFAPQRKLELQYNIATRSGSLWDTKQGDAINRGNILHDLLSQIRWKTDIDDALKHAIIQGNIAAESYNELKEMLNKLVSNPILEPYFSPKYTIYNEQELLGAEKQLLRPDRLVIDNKKNVVIIDYKTGKDNPKYAIQLNEYEQVLKFMGYTIKHKLLVFINEEIEVKIQS